MPVSDPSFLFDQPEYQETGTVFWPDPKKFQTLPESDLWEIFGLPYRQSPDQESGQLLIDKQRAWQALNLCNWYNEHSDFYYKHVYGDKETFRFAWQRLEQPISWIPTFASEKLLFTLLQHDFDGQVLFQHRFYRKWSLYGMNTSIPNFRYEELCRQFLEELRTSWQPQQHLIRKVRQSDRQQMESLAGRRFLYNRLGRNRWLLELGANGFVKEGYGPNEYFWWCEDNQLVFAGIDGKQKCRLSLRSDKSWQGRQLDKRTRCIELQPVVA